FPVGVLRVLRAVALSRRLRHRLCDLGALVLPQLVELLLQAARALRGDVLRAGFRWWPVPSHGVTSHSCEDQHSRLWSMAFDTFSARFCGPFHGRFRCIQLVWKPWQPSTTRTSSPRGPRHRPRPTRTSGAVLSSCDILWSMLAALGSCARCWRKVS